MLTHEKAEILRQNIIYVLLKCNTKNDLDYVLKDKRLLNNIVNTLLGSSLLVLHKKMNDDALLELLEKQAWYSFHTKSQDYLLLLAAQEMKESNYRDAYNILARIQVDEDNQLLYVDACTRISKIIGMKETVSIVRKYS